jgi:hypothetical protein
LLASKTGGEDGLETCATDGMTGRDGFGREGGGVAIGVNAGAGSGVRTGWNTWDGSGVGVIIGWKTAGSDVDGGVESAFGMTKGSEGWVKT